MAGSLWKCEYCDTYNPESAAVCPVCGEARSEASLAEARARRRAEEERRREEKRREKRKRYEKGFDGILSVFRVVFFLSLAALLCAVIYYLVMGAVARNLDSFQANLQILWNTVSARAAETGTGVATAFRGGFLSGRFGSAGESVGQMLSAAGSRLRELYGPAYGGGIPAALGKRAARSVGQLALALKELISGASAHLR